MYLIFFARKSSQKYFEGRYLCNRGPEGANYEVICPRAVTCTIFYKNVLMRSREESRISKAGRK